MVKRTPKIGDLYYHNIKMGITDIFIIIEIIDYNAEDGLYKTKQSIGREYKLVAVKESFITNSCTIVNEKIDLLHHLNKPLNKDELTFAKKNGFSFIGKDHKPITPINPNKKFIDYKKSQPVTQEQTFDTVFKPKHYNSTKFETIDVIEDMLSSYDKIESLPSSLPYFLGNTIKYIARSPLKGNMLEDLEKASYYLNKAISKLKEDKKCLK